MKICRFKDKQNVVRIGLVTGGSELLDLSPAGITRLQPLLESDDPLAELKRVDVSVNYMSCARPTRWPAVSRAPMRLGVRDDRP